MPKDLSASLDYAHFAKNDSRANTPPTFAIYILMLVGRWLEERHRRPGKNGGPQRPQGKAALRRDRLQRRFLSPARPRNHCRSKMNVTFRLPSEELEKAFVKEAAKHKLMELKGHRSVGGIRASIYNAMPLVGVETLAKFMADFAKKRG